MRLEIQLKKVLKEYHLYERGIEKRMAKECKLHRQTIGKLMRNESSNPSLTVLGTVCKWLLKENVKGLPGVLFGIRQHDMWEAFSELKFVSIYLGMYSDHRKDTMKAPAWMSVARYDVSVATRFSHFLSDTAVMGETRPTVKTHYQPFKYGNHELEIKGAWFEADKKRANEALEEVKRKQKTPESAIILGSQKANYLTECYIADLFDTRPFEPVSEKPDVPFYLCYREFDWAVPSCFGGEAPPPGFDGPVGPGLYYLDSEEKWRHSGWKRHVQDSGVVVMINDAGSIDLVVFGFSGRATRAIGINLIDEPETFWPDKGNNTKKSTANATVRYNPVKNKEGKEISVFTCCVTFSQDKAAPDTLTDEDYDKDDVVVEQMPPEVLEKFL